MDAELERLGVKLLETLHLSVPERKRLPPGGVPLSALVAGVTSRLDATGWFPQPPGSSSEEWTGARLERRGSELWVHERYEIGVARVGPIRTKRVDSIEEAVRMFMNANGGLPLDGVPVNWTA